MRLWPGFTYPRFTVLPEVSFRGRQEASLLDSVLIAPLISRGSPRIRTKPETVVVRIVQRPKSVDSRPVRGDAQRVRRARHEGGPIRRR
jgi:hypothetical protein